MQSTNSITYEKAFLLTLFLYAFKTYSQDTLSITEIKFNQIRDIGYELLESKKEPRFSDSAFNYFLKQKTVVMPFLIEKITDTTFTVIKRNNSGEFLKKGDLAIILLSSIEPMPFYSITKTQFCICCETGYLPVDFLAYVDKDRNSFQAKYRLYFYGQERKAELKRNRRRAG